jgi:hypothetical protein
MKPKNECKRNKMCAGIFLESSVEGNIEKSMNALEILNEDELEHFLVHLSQNIFAFYEAIRNESTEQTAFEFLTKLKQK